MTGASKKQQGKKLVRRAAQGALALAFVGVLGIAASHANAQTQDFFDWSVVNPSNPAPDTGAGFAYVPAPLLTSSNLAQVESYLDTQAGGSANRLNPTNPLAIKVQDPTVTAATLQNLASTYKLSFVFFDIEGNPTTIDPIVAPLSAAITAGAASASYATPAIGNFAVTPLNTDSALSSSYTFVSTAGSVSVAAKAADFRAEGLNMVTEELYPGQSDLKNPANVGSGSVAPATAAGIRSSFFTVPLERLSSVSSNISSSTQHIPYIARFNNYGNANMTTKTGSTPDTSAGLPAFVAMPGHATPNGISTDNALLSRDDFQALALQYRLRGATSVQLLDPGIVGYSQLQMETDVSTGWFLPQVQALFASNQKITYATFDNTINVDGTVKTLEAAGVVWSGVEAGVGVGANMAILISNLTDSSHTVLLPTKLSAVKLNQTSFVIGATSHVLLTFAQDAGGWELQSSANVFNDASLASHEGIGIPEPTSLSLLTLGGLGILLRRRRKA